MVDRVVLDIELLQSEFGPQALGMKQRREARVEPDRRLAVDRQQLAIAPEISRARLDNRARDRGLDFRVVVDHFERAEAGLAHVERLDRIFLAALAALQACDVAHRSPRTLTRRARRS